MDLKYITKIEIVTDNKLWQQKNEAVLFRDSLITTKTYN